MSPRLLAKLAVVVVLVLIVFALIGCATTPERGVVVDKNFRAGHNETTLICAKSCIPVTNWVGPKWRLLLDDGLGTQGWLSVDETTYHAYDIGSQYPAPR